MKIIHLIVPPLWEAIKYLNLFRLVLFLSNVLHITFENLKNLQYQ